MSFNIFNESRPTTPATVEKAPRGSELRLFRSDSEMSQPNPNAQVLSECDVDGEDQQANLDEPEDSSDSVSE